MKVRTCFVSNSSSSSFVIHHWSDIPEELRNYIMNYTENALKVWQDHGIEYEMFDGTPCRDVDDDIYSFGDLDNGWSFTEQQETDSCLVSTIMDNFDMAAWLKYNSVKFEVEWSDNEYEDNQEGVWG